MNEFTKEELEDLLYCVKDHTGYQGDSIHKNLIDKIQSFIDNYCEHEKVVPNYDCKTQCYKCGIIL